VRRPKHVEQLRNIGIINSTTWSHLVGSFSEIYITMNGSMNVKNRKKHLLEGSKYNNTVILFMSLLRAAQKVTNGLSIDLHHIIRCNLRRYFVTLPPGTEHLRKPRANCDLKEATSPLLHTSPDTVY